MGETINPFGKDIVSVETEFCGRKLTLETGRLAFQASGTVTATYGETVVMGIVTAAEKPDPRFDYFPLSIDYEEKMYAAGKISGSRFIKREGRPSEAAVLAGRLIDRPIRPLFPKGYRNQIQAVGMVLSVDPELKPDLVAMIAISTALKLSGVPFAGPIAGVRIGLIDDKLVSYPTYEEIDKSDLDLVIAGTKDAVMMVEAGANEVDETIMVKAIEQAHDAIQPAIAAQEELVSKVGVEEKKYEVIKTDEDIQKAVEGFLNGKLGDKVRSANKEERDAAIHEIRESLYEEVVDEEADNKDEVGEAFSSAIKQEVRRGIIEDGARPDGRKMDEIRPLSSEVGILPRAHGSSIFTRGTTQAMNVVTLAPMNYGQIIDTMEEDREKHYIHHYNMPGYTVGEIRRIGSPGRREIGHGALAERALMPVIPDTEEFPYTIRTVSEMMSSNGSTSMASVCSSCLSLMDAGVPIKKPVAGIAMGLITHGEASDDYTILSDIQGTEDFAGDMDFKVTGTKDGITALQMDIKVQGITPKIMADALKAAHAGREVIMESMLATIDAPRKKLSPYAPQVESMMVNPEKVRDIIGKGGETINKIIDETGAEIDIRDGGHVMVSAPDQTSIEAAKEWIEMLTAEPEVGKEYDGKVVKIMEFGVFCEIMPGHEGLVHVSEMSDEHVKHPSDLVKEGDPVRIKLVAIDDRDRLVLSMKQASKK